MNELQKTLEIVFGVSDDLIFLLDSSGNFTQLNENGAVSLGYSADEMIGKHLISFVPAGYKTQVAEFLSKTFQTANVINFEALLEAKNSNELIFEFNCKAMFKDGIVNSIIGMAKNITEFKKSKQKLISLESELVEANRLISIERARSKRNKSLLFELNKMKSEFVSNVSHEFRTPLASIIGFAETIDSDENMPEEMKKEFNLIILNESKRLAKLINDILDLSRIEQGEIILDKSEHPFSGIMKDVIEEVKPKIKKKDISFYYELPKENVTLNCDAERIKQVFDGIIDNAVKFTDKGGRIRVIAQSLYKEVEVIVSDTGVGIPEKDLPYLFQKFYRVNRPGTEIPGTGLGLVFAKQIVDLHKGFISLQSDHNKGTSVLVKLPKVIKE